MLPYKQLGRGHEAKWMLLMQIHQVRETSQKKGFIGTTVENKTKTMMSTLEWRIQ